jgi:hypothetical protein
MKKFEKIYVGKGQNPQPGLEITRITLKMAELEKLSYEYEGEKLVTLEVAKMKTPDQFNRTHTVYGTVLQEEKPPAKRKTRK